MIRSACLLLATVSLATVSLGAASLDITCTFDQRAPPAVLVWLPEVTGWQPGRSTIVDQRDQTFSPTIAVAPPGGIVEFLNSDTITHNIFALDPTQQVDLDLGLGAPGSTSRLTVAWPSGSVVKHGCKIHPQMQLWIASLDSPQHAVGLIAPGELRTTVHLVDIPAACSRLSFWAPRCAPLTVTFAIDATTLILRKDKPCGTLRVQSRP